MSYDEVLNELSAGKAGSGLPCAEVRRLLEELGFHVRDGANAGHKIVTHPKLSDFRSAAYNCQGGNGVVNRHYLGVLIRVIRMHKDGIKEYLGENG